MEVIRSTRGGNREIISNSSPDGAKIFMQPKVKPIRKVQIVYYLTRNGLLEHPHYMEVTHLANQPLRLKDVIDRLIVLRGKGMPSLYSWSCKRSYKNAYVWNDLAENDVIYPVDGAEVVLKGSELVEICSEKFKKFNVNIHSKRKPMTPNLHKTTYEHHHSDDQEEEQELEQEDYEEEEEEEKTSYTSSTTPHSRCSRGVSTDELEEQEQQNNKKQTHDHHQTASSLLCKEKPEQTSNSNESKRFEDGDDDENPSDSEPPSRNNSVFLQLISCGNLAVSKTKNVPGLKQPSAGKKSNVNGGLHKGVLCKSVAKLAEDEDIINYMSENPRFGNFQSEEKEYFSGSIVESASKDEIQPVLKKSNSYNERRSFRAGLEEAIQEVEEEDQKSSSFHFGVKGKCIPRKKSSSSSKKIRKIK